MMRFLAALSTLLVGFIVLVNPTERTMGSAMAVTCFALVTLMLN